MGGLRFEFENVETQKLAKFAEQRFLFKIRHVPAIPLVWISTARIA
jgi:hypothetical protein